MSYNRTYYHRKKHAVSDVEGVATQTLLVGMRKLYYETEQYMRARIGEMEERLAMLQSHAVEPEPKFNDANTAIREFVSGKKRGRPPGSAVKTGRSGWPATPEARSLEMKRRQKVAQAKRAEHFPIWDARNPGNKQWKDNLAKAQRAAWARKSAAERQAWAQKMAASSKKAKVKAA